MWSLLILKMKGNFFNQNEFFGIFFGSFYDFFVFYIVDFFTECFLRVKVKVIYHYVEQMTEKELHLQADFQ